MAMCPQHDEATNKQLYETDEFRIYCFKILPCNRRYPHDWSACQFAHPNEKIRRRNPRTHAYDCTMCANVVRGEECPDGPNCPHSHNAFESWLHPQKYRTLLCKDQQGCKRAVCFFAHGREELRVPSDPVPQMHTLGDGALPAAFAGLLRSTSNSSSNVSSPARQHYSGSSLTLQSGSAGSTPVSSNSNRYLLPVQGPGLAALSQNSSPASGENTEQLLAKLLAQVQLAWQESTPGSQATAVQPREQMLHLASSTSAIQAAGHSAMSGAFPAADSLNAQLFRPALSVSYPMAQDSSSSMLVQHRLHASSGPRAAATAAAEYLPVINFHGVNSAKHGWQHGWNIAAHGQTELGGLPSLSESSTFLSWDGGEPHTLCGGTAVSSSPTVQPASTQIGGQACSGFVDVYRPAAASPDRPWLMPMTGVNAAAGSPAAAVGTVLPQQQQCTVPPGVEGGMAQRLAGSRWINPIDNGSNYLL